MRQLDMGSVWRFLTRLVPLGVALLVAPTAAAAQTATIEGVVRDAVTNRLLEAAQVFVVGTAFGGVTNAQGQYRIVMTDVSAPYRVEVRARMIGFTQLTRGVEVASGRTVTLNFDLQQSTMQLDQVVITGSGQATEVRKLGNTVAIVRPPENMPMNDVSNLLQGREPGLVGLPSGGLSGEGAKIRIRGNASLSQTNEPIIFVDGIRINTGGGQRANGNVGSSRLDDIDPNSIERVEVLKGAAAATLYGTEASNGVIQIFTKRGQAGAPRWRFTLQQEAMQLPDVVAPNAFYVKTAGRADTLAPILGFTPTPYQVYEVPLFRDNLTETGNATTLGVEVQGGSPTVTYYISGRSQREDGPFGNRSLGPSDDIADRKQVTVNLGLIPTSRLRISIRNSYTDGYLQSPEANNNVYGANSLAYMARPEFANCDRSSVAGPFRCSAAGNPFGNQAFMTVREAMQQQNEQEVGRYVGAIEAQYTIADGLSAVVGGGYDFTSQRDVGFSRFGYNVDLFTAQTPDGARFVAEERQGILTFDGKLNWNKDFSDAWQSSAVVGLQVFNNQTSIQTGSATNFPGPGIGVVGAGGLNTVVGETFLTSINGGYFLQEQLSYRDFLTFTVGGRYDFSSAFGENAGGVFYPKISASYVVSDHSLMQDRLPGWLTTLRIRGAIGQSGRQPGAFDKFTTFSPLTSELGAGLTPANLGNPDLRPEISTETEFGFEAGLFGNALGVDFTLWDRKVRDVLVAQQFAPSGGFRASQLNNIGELEANGMEIGLKWFAIQRPGFQADVFYNAAFLEQTLTSLGGAPPLKVGYIRYRGFLKEGYPLGALFSPRLAQACPAGGPRNNPAGNPIACYDPATQLPIRLQGASGPASTADLLTYFATPRDLKSSTVQSDLQPYLADYDGNGNLAEQFVGDVIPDWTGSFGFNMSLGASWKLSTMFEYKTGFLIQNLTDGFRNSQHPSIGSNRKEWATIEATLNNPASTPEERLAAAELYITEYRRLLEPGLHQDEPGDFTRLREVSLTWIAPEGVAARLGARSFSVTASGRNLLLWTKYSGMDPEANAIGRGIGTPLEQNFLDSVDAFGIPIPRRFSLTFNYGF